MTNTKDKPTLERMRQETQEGIEFAKRSLSEGKDRSTIKQQLNKKYNWRKTKLNEILQQAQLDSKVMTNVITKDVSRHHKRKEKLPFSNEEILNTSTEELVAKALEIKRQEIEKKIYEADLQKIKSDALKWNKFQTGRYEPFKESLKTWQPPAYTPVKKSDLVKKVKEGRVFVVTAFDWHIGALAEERYLEKGKDWNIEAAKRAIKAYIDSITKTVAADSVGFSSCRILFGGDLYNSLSGFTAQGTPIRNEVGGDTQFDAIMEMATALTDRMLEIFDSVEVNYVRGNHGGHTDYALGIALKSYYRLEPRIKFNVHSERTAVFKIGNVVIGFEHGASDQTKSVVPNNGTPLEAYIQKVFGYYPELLIDSKQRIYVIGDKHHFVHKEIGEYEYIQCGALPVGDQYASALRLHSRPRQNCFILDPNGLESVCHIYFD
jgi:hypothetical protein